jgi:hypothetical protein
MYFSRTRRRFDEIRLNAGEQNILDAAYLVVNRLASKCIQRLDLKGIDPTRASAAARGMSRMTDFFTAWCLN